MKIFTLLYDVKVHSPQEGCMLLPDGRQDINANLTNLIARGEHTVEAVTRANHANHHNIVLATLSEKDKTV